MTTITLDITGKVCPFCLLLVKKKLADLQTGDILQVICDHPPAATETIPFAMKQMGYPVDSKKIQPGIWELHIGKK